MEEQMLQMMQLLLTEQQKTNQRLDGIDTRLDGIDARLDNLETRMTRTEVMIENRVLPQLQLLAEGHEVLLKRFEEMPDLDAMAEDIEMLKDVARLHTQQIAEIRSAG